MNKNKMNAEKLMEWVGKLESDAFSQGGYNTNSSEYDFLQKTIKQLRKQIKSTLENAVFPEYGIGDEVWLLRGCLAFGSKDKYSYWGFNQPFKIIKFIISKKLIKVKFKDFGKLEFSINMCFPNMEVAQMKCDELNKKGINNGYANTNK